MTTTCPYCRADVPADEASTACPSCSAAHHAECWEENGGCAVHGCASSPTRPTSVPASAPTNPLPPTAPAPPPLQVSLPPDAPSPPRRRRWRTAVAVFALLVSLTAVGGAVALLVTQRKEPVASSSAAAANVASPARASTDAAAAPATTTAGGSPAAEDLTDAQIVRGARRVLTAHHRHLKAANGSPEHRAARRAFRLLSRDKQRAEAERAGPEGYPSGFMYWISKNSYENLRIGQAVTLPPADVTLEDWNPDTGVAFVCIDLGAYRGRTWVVYENGEWRYDAGYGHVPSREARYGNANGEAAILFGAAGGANGC